MKNIKIKLFADGANLAEMMAMYRDPRIVGFTTNPTLMRKAGVSDYERFAREVLDAIPDRPVSFEVFADELDEMARAGARHCRVGTQRQRQRYRLLIRGASLPAPSFVRFPTTGSR